MPACLQRARAVRWVLGGATEAVSRFRGVRSEPKGRPGSMLATGQEAAKTR